MKRLKLLWSFMKGNRLLYIGSIVSIALATVFAILAPLVLRFTIDSVIGDAPMLLPTGLKQIIQNMGGKETLMRHLWLPAVILIGLNILRGIFLYFKGKWSAVASESIAKNMRETLYDHLQHLPYDYHIKAETGDLIQRCTSDVDTIRRFLAVQLVEVGRGLFMITLAAMIMLSIDVQMTMIAMAVIPIIFGFSVVFFLKVKKAFKISDESEAEMSTVLQENLSGVRVVKAFAQQKYEMNKFDKKNSQYRDVTYRLIQLLAGYWSISDLLCLVQIGGVLMLGIYWASIGRISLGTLVLFNTYEAMLLWPVRQMGRILTDMGKSQVALERIGEILDQPREEESQDDLKPDIRGHIVFDHVTFGYDDTTDVLKDISLEIKPGQTIAIMGQTGSGKSSLVHLLARLYDYQQGAIKIDGIDLKKINKKWIRKHVGIVLQEPFLFSKTIGENISLAREEAKETEIIEAARVSAIHDVILDFEKGYETAVGEKGVTLSGGQKQRVAMARTLINNTPILVFDDSLSAVDTETDAAIRKALNDMNHQATTIIISHRVATLSEADEIIVLDKGRIVQHGTHDVLVKEEGLYQRVWTIQNDLEREMTQDIGKIV